MLSKKNKDKLQYKLERFQTACLQHSANHQRWIDCKDILEYLTLVDVKSSEKEMNSIKKELVDFINTL